MNFSRLDRTVTLYCACVFILIGLATLPGCIPPGLFGERVLDSDGRVITEGSGANPPTYTIPSSGLDQVDAVVYGLAAAAYGAIGYYVRKVKKNGTAEASKLQAEITGLQEQLEELQGSTRKPLTSSEIRALSRILEQDLANVAKPKT